MAISMFLLTMARARLSGTPQGEYLLPQAVAVLRPDQASWTGCAVAPDQTPKNRAAKIAGLQITFDALGHDPACGMAPRYGLSAEIDGRFGSMPIPLHDRDYPKVACGLMADCRIRGGQKKFGSRIRIAHAT